MNETNIGRLIHQGLLLACCVSVAVPAQAQRLPIRQGDLARVATGDSARLALWRVGRVLWVTRQTLFLAPHDGPDSVGVALSESVRLAVARPSPRHALLWGLGGMVVGGALGATVLSSAFDGENLAHGRALETAGFGIAGAMIGMVTGMAVGPRRWSEIPLTSDGIAAASATRSGSGTAQFGRRSYWASYPGGS